MRLHFCVKSSERCTTVGDYVKREREREREILECKMLERKAMNGLQRSLAIRLQLNTFS